MKSKKFGIIADKHNQFFNYIFLKFTLVTYHFHAIRQLSLTDSGMNRWGVRAFFLSVGKKSGARQNTGIKP